MQRFATRPAVELVSSFVLFFSMIGCGTQATETDAPAAEANPTDDARATNGGPSERVSVRDEDKRPTTPATVREARAVVDLTKFPRLEVTESRQQTSGALSYVAKSSLPAAMDFYRSHLAKSGWQEVQDVGQSDVSKGYAQFAHTKSGFHLSINFYADPSAPDDVNVSVTYSGNVDTRKLPAMPDAKSLYDSPATTMYVSPAKVSEVVEFTRKALAKLGWQEYGMPFAQRANNPDNQTLMFKQRGMALTAFVGVAPAQGGKTTVQYGATVLNNDLPVPADAADLDFNDNRPYLSCTTSSDVAEMVDFYRQRFEALGRSPRADMGGTSSDKSSLFFQRGPEEVLLVELTRTKDDRTAVVIQTLATDSLAAIEEPSPEPESPPSDVGGIKAVDIPLPESAAKVAYDAPANQIGFESPLKIKALLDEFRSDLEKEGWKENKEFAALEDNVGLLYCTNGEAVLVVTALNLGLGGNTEVTVTGEGLVWGDSPGASELAEDMPDTEDPLDSFGEESDSTAASVDNPALVRSFESLAQGSLKTIAFSPDGKTIAAAGFHSHAWDTRSGEEVVSPDVDDDITSLAYSPDGRTLAFAQADGTIHLWDVEDEEVGSVLDPDVNQFGVITFSPDGKLLASAGDDGKLILWDVRSGEPVRTIEAHEGPFNTVAFSPDGKTLATARFKLKLWDAGSGELKKTLSAEEGPPLSELAFSPDGKTLASAGLDWAVKLWDVATGEVKKTFDGHESAVSTVAFSPDGKTLATGDWGYTVMLWDAASGKAHRTLSGHSDSLTVVRFSPDGSMLATAANDGFVRLWDVAIAIQNPKSATVLAEADFGDEGGEPLAEEETAMEPEEIDGLPIPANNNGYGSSGTRFRKVIEADISGGIEQTLEFYRRELADRGWKESTDEAQIGDDEAKLRFASDGAELTLQLKSTARDTKMTLNLTRRDEAEKAGVLPPAGRARIIIGNGADTEVTVTIDGQDFKLAVGEGAEKPDGPKLDLKPGTYKVTVKMPGKEAITEDVKVGADESWGVIVLPDGPLPLQVY